MGGSQLKQLRTTLKDQGLNAHAKQSNSNKKRKRSTSNSGPSRAEKLAAIHESFNSFDTKLNKRKFDADKPTKGKPGQSKAASLEQRRKTLLPELQNRNRTGGILDRRIGEGDSSLTAEEKALERFALEQQRLHASGENGGSKRRSAFNLEEEDELTHLGKSLADAPMPLADQSDAFQLTLKKGGGAPPDSDDDEDAPRKKSRAEIMDEVIKKSKMYKAERQKAREEDDELRMKLDDDLEDLRAALQKDHAASKRQAAGLPEAEESPSPEDESSSEESDGDSEVAEQSQAAPPKVDRNLLAQLLADDKGDSGKDKQQEEEPADAYDQAVKELTFERRVRPTDRLKTEDERIMEAAQALKEAEDARQRRMKGEPDAAVSASAPQGDDLDDGFDLAESGGDGFDLGQGLQEQEMEGGVFSLGGPLSDEDESGSDVESGEEEEDEDVESDFAAELEADEEMDGAFSGSDADQEHLVKPATSSRRTAAKTTTDQDGENIGFVFPCPTDHEEFLEVLESAQVADAKGLSTVIERIRTLHHPKLAPENNDKLSTFLSVLLDHALYLSSAGSTESLNSLTAQILSLSNAYPLAASTHFRTKLSLMHKNFQRGISKGALQLEAKTWPGLPEVTLLRLVGLVWSTSDLSHPVVAPAMLLICEYLGQARVRTFKDVNVALLLCTIVLQYESLSKRVVPEVIAFLSNSLLILAPHRSTSTSLPGFFPVLDAFRPELTDLKLPNKKEEPVSRLSMSSSASPNAASLLQMTFALIDRFAQSWVLSVASVEMLQPLLVILQGIKTDSIHSSLKESLTRTATALERMLNLSRKERKPLRLQHHKPVPIPTFIPKFEEGYQPGRPAFDPDTARNEEAKLKSLVKKERKGAIRELRKDNRFIAEERAKMRDEKDKAYNTRINTIRAGLDAERAEEKDYQRSKAKIKSRDRRRAGGR